MDHINSFLFNLNKTERFDVDGRWALSNFGVKSVDRILRRDQCRTLPTRAGAAQQRRSSKCLHLRACLALLSVLVTFSANLLIVFIGKTEEYQKSMYHRN